MATTFELLPDAVIRLDADRCIAEVNAAAEQLLGQRGEVLLGVPVATAIAPRDLTGHPLLVDSWPSGTKLPSVKRIAEHQIVIATSHGDRRVQITGRYLHGEAARVEGLIVALRPSGRLHRVPWGAEVVTTVSHELRAPLTSVKGYTALLLNRWDRIADDGKRMMLEQVHHDADRVTRLITELLDISRLEVGTLVLRRQLVDLPRMAEAVVDKVGMVVAGLGCSIEFPEGFPRVLADPDKIEQVLTNLVENAAKYAQPAGIRIVGEINSTNVGVAVHDQGPGIPAADLPWVFQKFFRRDHGRPSGTGLGLWISRGLVEAHGGRLRVTSVEGEGSVFRFTLPLGD